MTADSPIDGQHFVGLEAAQRHGQLVAGERTAPDPLTTPGGGEGAEATQLDSFAARAEPICSNTVRTIRSMSRNKAGGSRRPAA